MGVEKIDATFDVPKMAAYIAEVEQAMDAAIAPANPRLRNALSQVLRGKGKRLRPRLTIACAVMCGAKIDENVISAAAAIELAHLASLIHDDIIDDAKIRWNKPALRAQEGDDYAIVAGDYLLALASKQAATVSTDAARVIANAIAEMCDGQAGETADVFNPARTKAAYFDVCRKKTAALFAAACEIGGLCAGTPEAQLVALQKYGESLGLSFQMIDDLLDVVAGQDQIGKPAGNDLREGVYTLPVILAGDTVKSWLGKSAKHLPPQAKLYQILSENGAINQTVAEIRHSNHRAALSLEIFAKNNPAAAKLASFPENYMRNVLKDFV
jgi:geranylgeranyl pyrophosphate synthase